MATIKIDQFHGISPRTHPSLLADGMAVTAHNCRLKNGKLVPLKEPTNIGDKLIRLENGLGRISDAKSIFVWKRGGDIEFLAYPGRVYMAEGNIADDGYDRVFMTGDTGIGTNGVEPCVYLFNDSSNSIIRHKIVKEPLPAPRIRLALGGHSDTNNTRYTYFFQTWVDQYGYESGISEKEQTYVCTCRSAAGSGDEYGWTITISAYGDTITCSKDGETYSAKADHCKVTLDGTTPVVVEMYSDDDLEYNDGDSVIIAALEENDIPDGGGTLVEPTEGYKRRIYKVVTGTETESIQFIAEFSADPWGQHTVMVKDEDAGEVLTEMENAPKDLRGMAFVPGGFYVGYSPSQNRTVMFSEVDIPVDWPLAYRYDIKDRIVGLAVTSNSVFVLTDGYPWIFSGTSPESMTATHIAGPAACVSERSICLYKNAVFFASNVGICTVYNDADAGTVCQNLTDRVFTKEQWNALNPSSCLMAQYDGALFCFFTKTDGTKCGYVIDLLESENAVTTHDEESTCLCTDNATDTLYFVRDVESEVD